MKRSFGFGGISALNKRQKVEGDNGVMSSNESLDLGLYSRQFYVLGEIAMLKMAKASVLVYGIDGLGVEIAKNIILGGFKSVYIMDYKTVSKMDLSTNYYASETDLGNSRVSTVVKKLAELNSYVEVRSHEGKLAEEHFSMHQIIVVVNQPLADLKLYGFWARSHGTKIIFTSTFGLVGQIFCDFGPEFESLDSTGREPALLLVSHITDDGYIFMVEGRLHGLSDGSFIRLPTLDGPGTLSVPICVEVVTPSALKIDPELILKYRLTRGDGMQVFMPEKFCFLPFEESMKNPDCILGNVYKFDYMSTYHLIFLTINVFIERFDRLPAIHDRDDSTKFCELALELNTGMQVPVVDKLDMKLCQMIAMQANACFAPLQGVIGGIVAQEVIKGTGQKYTPIKQWFYFDCLELIQFEGWREKDKSNFIPIDTDFSRNFGQISILGRDIQDMIEETSTFVVGAGAIGCELLKNFAMMSIACSETAQLHVTDMDSIERSNLNRQFLFRTNDIGKLKSECSASAAKQMNERLNIKAYALKVGEETESVFNNSFFDKMTCVMNALDNVEARRYVDSRCVSAQRPMIDGGTLGTLGNTQVVLPFKTESYSSSYDPQEKLIAICTLKNFPYLIQHTIQWARDRFEGLFKQTPELLSSIMIDRQYLTKRFEPNSYDFGESVKDLHTMWMSKPSNFDDCINYGLKLFDEYFNHSIKQLLFNIPATHISSNGFPFWIPPKKCPKPLEFDVNNDLHYDFVISVAILRACNFCISPNIDQTFINDILSSYKSAEFVPKQGVFIAEADEDETSRMKGGLNLSENDKIQQQYQQLLNDIRDTKVSALEFEKDDDTNYHMKFITACSNLRATCYGIATVNFNKTKQIAGRIIPAIATTTAVVAGMSCIELVKVILKFDDIEKYQNSFINLALVLLTASEPAKPKNLSECGGNFTIWDTIDVKGIRPDGKEMLLEDLINFLKDNRDLSNVSMISCGNKMLFASFNQNKKERLKKTLRTIYAELFEKPVPDHLEFLSFDVFGYDLEGEDVDLPVVKFFFG